MGICYSSLWVYHDPYICIIYIQLDGCRVNVIYVVDNRDAYTTHDECQCTVGCNV